MVTAKRRRYCVNTEGFIDADQPSHVYKFKEALYGLKQAPRAMEHGGKRYNLNCILSDGLPTGQPLHQSTSSRPIQLFGSSPWSTKRYKSSVQYADHPVGTVLDEPCLGMIMFNFHQRWDFVTIEDFGDLINEMMYIVQEIFFRLHQGPGLDDHARTFSSFLLVEGEIVRSVPDPFSFLVDLNIKSPKYKLVEDKFSFISLKTIQLQLFSLVDNSKLNDVDLLLEAKMKCFSFRRFTRQEKRLLYIKRNKTNLLGKDTSKVGIEVQLLSLKDCTIPFLNCRPPPDGGSSTLTSKPVAVPPPKFVAADPKSNRSGSKADKYNHGNDRTGKRRVFVQTESGCVLESSLTFGDMVLKNDLSAIRNDSPLLLTKNLMHMSSLTPCLSPSGRDIQNKDRSGPIEILGNSSSNLRTMLRRL
ncbi:hypothetical protein Tco_0454704 [Tanacetum coccineum]